jgi:molecular chaperone GrpE
VAKDIERGRRDILSDMLEVGDNLDRAIDSARQGAAFDALMQGVEMVRRQFMSKLEGLGVSRIDVNGQAFDPTLHEAITTVPATTPDQDGMVVGVIRSGYRIGDEVLRPAAVAVAKA